DEEQRSTLLVLVVDPRVLMSRCEIREDAVPKPAARGGDVIALVDLCGLLIGERIREGVVELLRRERDGLVSVRRIVQYRERGLDLRERNGEHALGGHGVDRDAGGAEAVIEQDLRERAAEGVT